MPITLPLAVEEAPIILFRTAGSARMPSPLHADARVHDFAVVLLIGEFVNLAMLPVNRDGSRYGGYCAGFSKYCAGFSDACMTPPSTHADGRRPRTAKARNRG